MDHVKGAFIPLFPKVMELLKLVECKMQIDLEKEVGPLEPDWESLKRELVSVQSKLEFLKSEEAYIDAELGKSPLSSGLHVKVWDEVRELSYDLDDVVDSFLVCLESSEPIPDIDTLKKLVQKMTNLNLAEKIPTDAVIQDVPAWPTSTTTIDPSVQAMHAEIQNLVGMGENMDRLKNMISGEVAMVTEETSEKMASKIKPKVACVVGFGGLGKTTLVRTLYDKIKKNYSCKAFVSVGQNANVKKVLVDILLSLDKEKKEKNYNPDVLQEFNEVRLTKEIREFLCKKRYLIIIDNIWNGTQWEHIKYAFRNDPHYGGLVFTTTRSLDVAKECCPSSDGHLIYQMKPLSDEDSKCLFYRRVFSQEGGQCHDDFKQVSAAILKKCGGVPLAIITIASLLASNGEGIKPMDEWNHVLNSIGCGLTAGHSVVEMNKILFVSYANLSPELKNCLLYTTVFPEDTNIKKGRLLSKWIAEGFVPRTNQEVSLFDVAENYFNMLINRSLIEPVNIDGEGKAKACRVHDMVLGFLCSLASESNFVTVIDGRTRTTSNSETKIRRLSLQACMATAPVVTPQLSAASLGIQHVRSFTLSTNKEDVFNLVPRYSTIQIIRVLDLLDSYLPWRFNLSDYLHIKSLLHVRYLGLSLACITVLPEDLGKLKFLQILELRTPIHTLPSSIVELRQLISLHVHPVTRLPDEFGKLTSLEKLTHVVVDQDSAYLAKQLGYLTKLRELRVSVGYMHLSLAKEFIESLNKLLEIRSLKFRDLSTVNDTNAGECITHMEKSWKPSSHLQKFQLEGSSFSLLPKWITESCNISSLSICLKKVRREEIKILGSLQYLSYLNLGSLEHRHNVYPAKQEEGFQFENDAFPVARDLRIAGIVTLPVMFPKGAMPKVQILEFHVHLEDFGNMNLEMAHLPALKQVNVIIWCNPNSQVADVNIAKAALMAAAESHPNRPTIDFFGAMMEPESDDLISGSSDAEVELFMPRLKIDEDEAAEKQLRSSDVEEVDAKASRQPLRPTEIGEASGFPSLPSLDPDEVKFKETPIWKGPTEPHSEGTHHGREEDTRRPEPRRTARRRRRTRQEEAHQNFGVMSARVSKDLTSDEITDDFLEEGKADMIKLLPSSSVFEPRKGISADLNKDEKAVKHAIDIPSPNNHPILQLDLPRPFILDCNLHLYHDGSVRASLGAMRPLVGKLDMLLQAPPQGCSSQRVKDKMQLLKEDVEEISSCLDGLSEVEEPPLTAKCWMNQAHDLHYDIEDYIDSLLFVQPAHPSLLSKNINGTRPRVKLSFHAKILKRLKRPEEIAGTVSKFSMFIQKAIERHRRYDLHSCSTLRHRFVSLGPMLPTPYEETAESIVIDGRMNEFINSLANDRDKQTKVISVLGSSCLGKTILSRVLYNRIGGQFDCRAFVRVSKQPDMKSIFRGMLSELQRQHPPQDCKEIDLIDNIKSYLQDKRYLVILDDVWAASVWDIINHAFPRGSHGCRIITTTQIDDVALTCCCYQSKHVFQMQPLDDDHSRKLFFSTLFGSESYSPGKFKEDLNKIVEICGGLPLATISIASLLVSQPVMTTELLDYIRKSLSSRFLEKSTSEKTRQALNLSFNNLPRYLKSCLLYLSMYPEGYEFLKYDLVKQWVTEGFIDTTEGQDIEKVAESYLDQLIGRRFIQPICISYNNEVVSCAVHDAIHDFIVHKSAEENFIVAIDHNRTNVSLSHIVRRLSLLFGDARYAKTPTSMSRSQIRSLRFSGLFECMPRIREFKLLRVLNLHLSGHPGNNDPPIDLTEISELFLLRYLKIASDVCIKLPNHMRGLQCLETLDVMAATRVTAVPWDIIHLPHLFNLTLPVERNLLDLIGSMGDSAISLWSTGKLNNLQSLHLTSSSSTPPSSDHLERSMEALGTLLGGHGNLKTLALTHDDGSWHKDASRVIISWDGLAPPPLLKRFEFSPHSYITFSRIPQWLKELGNLCILKITVRELQITCVDILRGMPALATLSLYVDTAAVDKIIFDNTGFSGLKYFKFRCSTPSLKFEAGAMPNLGKLMLGFNAIPQMDQHRHANAVITIEHMPGLKEISAKIGGATANTDAESALRTIVSNHQSNPMINVQLVDYIFYGEVSTKPKQQQTDEIVGLLLGETS